MIFTLEALQAKHGDALLLHYGEADDPQLIVIDGGPAGIYKSYLKKRLEELRVERALNGPLPVRLLMVSHIDDDHIRGVLELTRGLVELQENGESLPYNIFTLWHNGFENLVDDDPDRLFAGLYPAVRTIAKEGRLAADFPLSQSGALVVASVPQGRDLLEDADLLDLELNHPFSGLVAAPKKGRKTIKLGARLSFTVLGPNEQRIKDLRDEWERQIEKISRVGKKEAQAQIAAFIDDSVFNLSSIVVLATLGKRRMLLTGDARGDDILAGLKVAGLFSRGVCRVDLLKMPHHGSDRNVETDFFRQVVADHYVFSGDGKYGNPEIATLEMLSEARGKDRYTMHFTNREKRIENFFRRDRTKGRKYEVIYRKASKISLKVDLETETVL
jgi:hypothetical protein